MQYEQILAEFEDLGIKNKFSDLIESIPLGISSRIKVNDNLYSAASVLRSALRYLQIGSKEYTYWLAVLHYLIVPKGFREDFDSYIKPFTHD